MPPPDLALAAARFGPVSCGGFAAGTLLDTPGGPVPVERLRPGDRLTTLAGGSIRIRYAASVGAVGGQVGVVLLLPDALGPGRPRRALRLSVRQAVWLAESSAQGAPRHALAAAGLLCGGAVRRAGALPLYLLLAEAGPLGDGAVVLAEGLPCALRPPTRPEHDPHAGAALAAARMAQQGWSALARLDGAVTLDARQRLSGWALDRTAPEVPVLLEILLDDLTIGFALADEVRPDLAMAGLGACGFAFALALPSGALPARALPSRRWPSPGGLLRLHIVGTGTPLPGTPLPGTPLPGTPLLLGPADG